MSGHSGQHPRVLIVGQDFTAGTGGGITMSCLFKGWPCDRIAVAAAERELGESGFAARYYRLGALEDRWIWPLSAIPRERWKISGPVTPEAGCVHKSESPPGGCRSAQSLGSSRRRGVLPRRVGYTALRITGANDLLRGLHLSESLRAWVAAYQPDVIYSQLSSLGLVRLVGTLVHETGTPLALHFMDDWASALYRRGLLAPILRRKLRHELEALIEQAALLMAISGDMSREFGARYGRDFRTFHNALELGEWARTRRTSWEAGRPFEVLYAGRIGMTNQASMLDVAEAVGSLVQGGMSMRFTILTPDGEHPVVSTLRRFAHLDVLSAIPHREIPARLAAADVLVLPLDFGEHAQTFARFSMPTKTVEYMASGTPTIVYAPAQNAISRYATSQKWAWVVGRRNGRDLAAGLRVLAQSADERERLARRSVELALAHHDADAVRRAFRAALESAAADPKDMESKGGIHLAPPATIC